MCRVTTRTAPDPHSIWVHTRGLLVASRHTTWPRLKKHKATLSRLAAVSANAWILYTYIAPAALLPCACFSLHVPLAASEPFALHTLSTTRRRKYLEILDAHCSTTQSHSTMSAKPPAPYAEDYYSDDEEDMDEGGLSHRDFEDFEISSEYALSVHGAPEYGSDSGYSSNRSTFVDVSRRDKTSVKFDDDSALVETRREPATTTRPADSSSRPLSSRPPDAILCTVPGCAQCGVYRQQPTLAIYPHAWPYPPAFIRPLYLPPPYYRPAIPAICPLPPYRYSFPITARPPGPVFFSGPAPVHRYAPLVPCPQYHSVPTPYQDTTYAGNVSRGGYDAATAPGSPDNEAQAPRRAKSRPRTWSGSPQGFRTRCVDATWHSSSPAPGSAG